MIEFFSEGDFQIREPEIGDISENPYASWIYHICEEFARDRPRSEVSGVLMLSEIENEKCAFCYRTIPASVIALWRFHNWDVI